MTNDRFLLACAAVAALALPVHILVFAGARQAVDPQALHSAAQDLQQDIANLGKKIDQESASQAMLAAAKGENQTAAREVADLQAFLKAWSQGLWVEPPDPKLDPNEIVSRWKTEFSPRRDAVFSLLSKVPYSPRLSVELPNPYEIAQLTPEIIRRKQFDKRIRIVEALVRLLVAQNVSRLDGIAFNTVGADVAQDPYRMVRTDRAHVFEVEAEFDMPWIPFTFFLHKLANDGSIPFSIRRLEVERIPEQEEQASPAVRVRLVLWVLDFQPDPPGAAAAAKGGA